MKHHFHLLFIITLLLCVNSYAQEWPGAWMGATQDFTLSDNLLSYLDDGKAGRSDIFLEYEVAQTMVWSMEVRWNQRPTSYNTFSWLLFEERMPDSNLYRYEIEPASDGSTIYLVRKYCRPKSNNNLEIISKETLDGLSVRSPQTDWEQMSLSVQYDAQVGLTMQAFAPFSELTRSEPITLKGGTMRGLMGLLTKYTAIHKLDHHWTIPTVSSEVHEAPLKAEKITAQESGRVNITLNKAVDISSASVTVPGFSPSMVHGASSKNLIIELGQSFASNRVYDFTISNLLNMQGGRETLEFSIDTTVEDQPNNQGTSDMPLGIFITEVMAAPPAEGELAEKKYIELYNNTDELIRLDQLILLYRTQKIKLPAVAFAPHSYLILYPLEDSYPNQTNAIAVEKFPALSREFNLAILEAQSLTVLDEVYFSAQLYGYGEKRGGASVERITYNPGQWRRSGHPNGGTPGFGTVMTPFAVIPEHSIIINEMMLSPSTTGEKYIELYNNGNADIDLTHLFLSYRNSPDGTRDDWSLVNSSRLLKAGGYCVLCPFPEALPKIHSAVDASTFVERIDFPSISPTYTEVDIRSRADNTVIDAIIYRRQWLGERSNDRTKYALERISPDADGRERSSWRKATEASNGGTPGIRNSVYGLPPDSPVDESELEWPDTPELSYEEMTKFMKVYPQFSSIDVFTLDGKPLYSGYGDDAKEMLRRIQYGQAGFPTMIVVLRITFTHPSPDKIVLTFGGRWAHTPTL